MGHQIDGVSVLPPEDLLCLLTTSLRFLGRKAAGSVATEVPPPGTA